MRSEIADLIDSGKYTVTHRIDRTHDCNSLAPKSDGFLIKAIIFALVV